MYLAYLDESGDSGLGNSPTHFFVLACVLVHESNWLGDLNLLVDLRRDLRATYGIPTRPEIKATDMVGNRGILRQLKNQLARPERIRMFDSLLGYQAGQLSLRTFAVAIEKGPAAAKGWDARYAAWTFALQRINRFCEQEGEWASIYPDEGHGFFIKRRIRHMRRHHAVKSHWGKSTVRFEIQRVIEDPNERASHDSYFVQLADWNAYAAHRSQYVHPHAADVQGLWDTLLPVVLTDVNKLRGGPPGIVRYP